MENIEAIGLKKAVGKCFQEKLQYSNGSGRGQVVGRTIQTTKSMKVSPDRKRNTVKCCFVSTELETQGGAQELFELALQVILIHTNI